MAVLLLRLVGPMQSWGTQSHFSVRETGPEPSKSGVIGLLCAALGRPRSEPVDDLAALRMGVRVDVEGTLQKDFHTAQDVLKADGKDTKPTEMSNRYYLADARFLVGLEGEDVAFLRHLHEALRAPVWPLYLGRKAFVPSEPVWLCNGLRLDEGLEEALKAYPWLGNERYERPEKLRLVLEDERGVEMRRDQPLDFTSLNRRFLPRRLRVDFVEPPTESWGLEEERQCISPD